MHLPPSLNFKTDHNGRVMRNPSASARNGHSKLTLEEAIELLGPKDDESDLYDEGIDEKEHPKKRITAKELLGLFQAWEKENDACVCAQVVADEALATLQAAKERRSDAARVILLRAGHGQYEYPAGSGRVYTPWSAAKGPRDGQGRRSYYLRDVTKKRRSVNDEEG
jgi:hypothetical protein